MNEVLLEIDDASKTLIAEETLTSGSRYRVVVKDGAARVGAGDLIVTVPPQLAADLPFSLREPAPAVAARASLAASGTDAEGVLNTSTDVLQVLAHRRPRMETVFPCVLHSTTNGENVATGFVRIRLCKVANGEPTGAALLYKGDKGDRGERGELGPQGERGPQGEQGPQGERGERGEQGAVGPRGRTGERGETGPQGERGERGEQGAVGPRGRTGEQGAVGPRGAQGVAGEKGDRGERGERGPANAETKYVRCAETGKWHKVAVKHNRFGEAVVTAEEEETGLLPGDVGCAVEGLFAFEIGEDGHLYVVKAERADDIDFEINENGHLIMTMVA